MKLDPPGAYPVSLLGKMIFIGPGVYFQKKLDDDDGGYSSDWPQLPMLGDRSSSQTIIPREIQGERFLIFFSEALRQASFSYQQ